MKNEERTAITVALLNYFPEVIKSRLIADRQFRRRSNFHTVAQISFNGTDSSFSRNELFEAVSRVFLSGSKPETISDKAGNIWQLKFDEGLSEPILAKEGQSISLGHLWYLASDDTTRRVRLELTFDENRACGTDLDLWRELLAANPIDFEDVEIFHEAVERTPTQIILGIRASIAEGSSRQEVLTPIGLHYYERLVGPRGGAYTITDFANTAAKEHIKALLEWNAEEGLRQSLLMGSHTSLVPTLPEDFDVPTLERVIAWAASRGDRISQTAAFELGLRYVKEKPFLMPHLVSIAEQIRDDDPEDPNGRLLLLSNLYIFVDGSIAHLGYLRDSAPYWRRVSSIAQASLIEREFVRGRVSVETSTRWLENGCGTLFYLQNSIDGRHEPRWLPDLATSKQWKQELAGRLVAAAGLHANAVKGTPLERIVRSSDTSSLRSQLEFPFAYLPGPIEGGLDRLVEAPPEFEAFIKERLAIGAIDPTSLQALFNTCLVFRTPPELAEQVAVCIKAAKYRVRDDVRTGQNFSMLSGLALVAAATRSHDLAREIRVLNRVALRRLGSDLNILQSFRICVIAANAFHDIVEWRQFVGEWITELAFGEIDRAMANQLFSLVQGLCKLEPALWASLSKAHAALGLYTKSV